MIDDTTITQLLGLAHIYALTRPASVASYEATHERDALLNTRMDILAEMQKLLHPLKEVETE